MRDDGIGRIAERKVMGLEVFDGGVGSDVLTDGERLFSPFGDGEATETVQ